jgi:NAD(P)-dependent dehydrogenase (short-subunit alcohol dehydrogenase family)
LSRRAAERKMSLPGKVAMITGGGGGIGRAVAKSFSDQLAKVFVTDAIEETAKRTETEIRDAGGTCNAEKVDVRSYDEIINGVEHCVNTFGKVDILVNCAGILTILPFDKITGEIWDEIMAVNAKGTFLTCQAVAQQMIRQGDGGKIINVSSVAGKIGAPMYTHYCASKFAVIGITKSLALELAKDRINVNAVCPGDVYTDMLEYEFKTHAQIRGITPEEVRKQLTTRVPLGRLAQPIDVANVILFLASEKAGYMTGQALNVTGGTLTF